MVMKTFLYKVSLILLGGFLALQPTLVQAHGDSGGGGGGDSGGDSDGGGGGKGEAANPEIQSPPDGFAGSNTASVRAYVAKTPAVDPAQLQVLTSQGYVSESDQSDRGNSDWQSRPSAKSQGQWGKHGPAAYDVTATKGGAFLADAHAMAAGQADLGAFQSLADAAWSKALTQSLSVGGNAATGLGTSATRNPDIANTRQNVSLKDLIDR